MKGIPFVPKPPRIDPNGSISRTLLLTVIGTTISIILTFGTSQLLQTHRKAKDRKMTAMMVMGNIESYASELDDISFQLGWRDTTTTLPSRSSPTPSRLGRTWGISSSSAMWVTVSARCIPYRRNI